MKHNQFVQQHEDINPSTPDSVRQKLKLIDGNVAHIRKLIKLSLKISGARLACFVILMFYDKQLIEPVNSVGQSDIWGFIFYIIASMMDVLTILNDLQMLKLLRRQQLSLQQTKNDILSQTQNPTDTSIGSYKNYLSIYDLLKIYKYCPRSSSSISQTIRYLHSIITFYSFGNLAISSQNKNDVELYKCFVLWIFILSIYFSTYELDFITLEGSSGPFVEKKLVTVYGEIGEHQDSVGQKQIKEAYVKSRRPFEIMYVLNILTVLCCLVLYYQNDILSFMLIFCIATHMTELVHQKYLQNHLMTLDISVLGFVYLTPYRMLRQLTKKHKIVHLFISSLTRYSIVLSILAYFRTLSPSIIQSFLLFTINIMLFYGQHLKFSRSDKAKLYYLRPCRLNLQPESNFECSICLMNCTDKDQLLALPCFSNHIYHFKCMKNWLAERKQCPLCRFSLQMYDIE